MSDYDGRKQEPPYDCQDCAEKDDEIERLREALREILFSTHHDLDGPLGAAGLKCDYMVKIAQRALDES